MKAQKHTWKEYQYRHANDNTDARRMWMRNEDLIFEVADGRFITANTAERHEGFYSSFEEAVDKIG